MRQIHVFQASVWMIATMAYAARAYNWGSLSWRGLCQIGVFDDWAAFQLTVTSLHHVGSCLLLCSHLRHPCSDVSSCSSSPGNSQSQTHDDTP